MVFHALNDPLKYMIHCTYVIYLYFGVVIVVEISIIILYKCLHVFSNLS